MAILGFPQWNSGNLWPNIAHHFLLMQLDAATPNDRTITEKALAARLGRATSKIEEIITAGKNRSRDRQGEDLPVETTSNVKVAKPTAGANLLTEGGTTILPLPKCLQSALREGTLYRLDKKERAEFIALVSQVDSSITLEAFERFIAQNTAAHHKTAAPSSKAKNPSPEVKKFGSSGAPEATSNGRSGFKKSYGPTETSKKKPAPKRKGTRRPGNRSGLYLDPLSGAKKSATSGPTPTPKARPSEATRATFRNSLSVFTNSDMNQIVFYLGLLTGARFHEPRSEIVKASELAHETFKMLREKILQGPRREAVRERGLLTLIAQIDQQTLLAHLKDKRRPCHILGLVGTKKSLSFYLKSKIRDTLTEKGGNWHQSVMRQYHTGRRVRITDKKSFRDFCDFLADNMDPAVPKDDFYDLMITHLASLKKDGLVRAHSLTPSSKEIGEVKARQAALTEGKIVTKLLDFVAACQTRFDRDMQKKMDATRELAGA